jgi:hypothetical protein
MYIEELIRNIKSKPRSAEVDQLVGIIETLLPGAKEDPLYVVCSYYNGIDNRPSMVHNITFVEPTLLSARLGENQIVLKASPALRKLYTEYQEATDKDALLHNIVSLIEEELYDANTSNTSR